MTLIISTSSPKTMTKLKSLSLLDYDNYKNSENKFRSDQISD